MLLVLAVLMTVVGIAIPTYKTFEIEKEEQRFFELLLHDIYFAQSESYKTQSPVAIMFRENPQSYEIVRNIHDKISDREFPGTVSLNKTSNITEIVYWSNASVLASGTLKFRTSTGEKTIVVHLGKGRVVYSG